MQFDKNGMRMRSFFAKLHEKIDSAENAAAFDKVISFLDHVESIEIPTELADLLNETYRGIEAETLESITQGEAISRGAKIDAKPSARLATRPGG